MQTRSIEIDLDVHKAIEGRRMSLVESENDILRRALDLDSNATDGSAARRAKQLEAIENRKGLVVKGVLLWEGMRLRATLKGVEHRAEIHDGAIVYAERRFDSPSGAACAAAGTNVNGWRFWLYKDPKTGGLQSLDSWRRREQSKDLV